MFAGVGAINGRIMRCVIIGSTTNANQLPLPRLQNASDHEYGACIGNSIAFLPHFFFVIIFGVLTMIDCHVLVSDTVHYFTAANYLRNESITYLVEVIKNRPRKTTDINTKHILS